MKHFNKLTPAELERLGLLSEELGEAQQIIGKILRHGYQSYNPFDEHLTTNKALLEKELGDIQYAIKMMLEGGDINDYSIAKHAEQKAISVIPWLHHQDERVDND